MSKAAQLASMSKNYLLPRWATFVKYGKSELAPPSPGEIGQAIAQGTRLVGSAATFQWRKATMRDAILNTLVAVEVVCWFFVGECIGKGSIIGYQVGYPKKAHH